MRICLHINIFMPLFADHFLCSHDLYNQLSSISVIRKKSSLRGYNFLFTLRNITAKLKKTRQTGLQKN